MPYESFKNMPVWEQARGSATETQSHTEYAKRVGYVAESDANVIDVQLATLIHDINKIVVVLTSQP